MTKSANSATARAAENSASGGRSTRSNRSAMNAPISVSHDHQRGAQQHSGAGQASEMDETGDFMLSSGNRHNRIPANAALMAADTERLIDKFTRTVQRCCVNVHDSRTDGIKPH